jgi:hypothetical protein
MKRYEIGEQVIAEQLRVGDLFGEERIEQIGEHTDAYGYVVEFTVTVSGGAWFHANTFDTVVVPHHHSVAVTVSRRDGIQFEFTCHAQCGTCRQACARCELPAAYCACLTPDVRAVACRLITRCNGKDVATLLLAYDGEPAPVRSGPVMLYPTPDGIGCMWRYATENTDEG